MPRCGGAAGPRRFPLWAPPGTMGSAGRGRGAGAAPRHRQGAGAMPTCSVVPRSLHLGEAVGHGQLQVLILILAVRVEADGRGARGPVRGGRWGRGGPWAREGLLLPPAQLQPQRHVVRDTCGDRGRGWGLCPLQLPRARTRPQQLLPTPPILQGRAPNQGRPGLRPKPSLDAAPRCHPKGGEGSPRGKGTGRWHCQTPPRWSAVLLLTIDVD